MTTHTYDIYFSDNENSNNKGFKESLEYCMQYIQENNGTSESYFADYPGGIVEVRCNETGETIYDEQILSKYGVRQIPDVTITRTFTGSSNVLELIECESIVEGIVKFHTMAAEFGCKVNRDNKYTAVGNGYEIVLHHLEFSRNHTF